MKYFYEKEYRTVFLAQTTLTSTPTAYAGAAAKLVGGELRAYLEVPNAVGRNVTFSKLVVLRLDTALAGNVGIGTANPTAGLHLKNSSMRITGNLNNASSRPALTTTPGPYEIRGSSTWGDTSDDGFLRLSAGGGSGTTAQSFIDVSGYSTVADMVNSIVFGSAGAERMRITNLGNVGIGITNPSTTLHTRTFTGYSSDAQPVAMFETSQGAPNKQQTLLFSLCLADASGGSAANSYSFIRSYIPGLSDTSLVLQPFGGNVGVGTKSPIAPLHVETSTYYGSTSTMPSVSTINSGQGYYFNYVQGTATWSSAWGVYTSIYARRSIVCSEQMLSASDERIKKNIQPVQEALDKIRRLDVVSYDRIDFRDNSVGAGVLARNVQNVLPKAVHATKSTIPNIYLKATHLKIRSGVLVEVKCDDKDIKEGSSVKLMIVQGDKEIEHVSTMTNWTGTSFEVEEWKDYSEEDKVFAYGVEVDDFLNVDKDQIGILAAGAVKELDGIVAEQSREISELKRLVRSLLG